MTSPKTCLVACFLATNQWHVCFIHNEVREPVCLNVDACTNGCHAICQDEAYHAEFPQHSLCHSYFICHLKSLNAIVALKMWVHKFSGKLLHLFCDNTTTVAIFQVRRGRDPFMQVCAKEVWLTCAISDVKLGVGHVAREDLIDSADTLSCWHSGQLFKDGVSCLITNSGVKMLQVPDDFFTHASNSFVTGYTL